MAVIFTYAYILYIKVHYRTKKHKRKTLMKTDEKITSIKLLLQRGTTIESQPRYIHIKMYYNLN